jgi:hypothetical protein
MLRLRIAVPYARPCHPTPHVERFHTCYRGGVDTVLRLRWKPADYTLDKPHRRLVGVDVNHATNHEAFQISIDAPFYVQATLNTVDTESTILIADMTCAAT